MYSDESVKLLSCSLFTAPVEHSRETSDSQVWCHVTELSEPRSWACMRSDTAVVVAVVCVFTSAVRARSSDALLPFLMPEFRDKFLVTLAEGGLLVSADQSTAVQEVLGKRWARREWKGGVKGSKVKLNRKLITRHLSLLSVTADSVITSWRELEELRSCSTSFQCFSSQSSLQSRKKIADFIQTWFRKVVKYSEIKKAEYTFKNKPLKEWVMSVFICTSIGSNSHHSCMFIIVTVGKCCKVVVPLGLSSSSSDSEPSSSATAIGTPFMAWPTGWAAASWENNYAAL